MKMADPKAKTLLSFVHPDLRGWEGNPRKRKRKSADAIKITK
jgi:hypothetical protein